MAIYENKFEIGDVVWFERLGRQYSAWNGLADLLDAKRFSACTKATKCVVKNYTLYKSLGYKEFVYLLEDDNGSNYLVSDMAIELYSGQDKMQQKAEPQQYKPRAKWVKNTGEKPDLPDGTLVTIKWCDGDMFDDVVEDIIWKIGYYPTNNIVKWKLANDWNKVVDGKVPAIDPSTLIEVKNEKDYGGNKYKGKVDDFAWAIIKKWRYAKKD